MSARLRRLVLVLAASSLLPASARAEKLDKEAKKWLDEVTPIMLPSEEKTYKDLSKDDRAEFQKIFWARRDPNLETPENEYKTEYDKVRADADRRYTTAGRAGSTTDCGRLLILLGEPDDVKRGQRSDVNPGARPPETWTFSDKPGTPSRFKDGRIQIIFDEFCEVPGGGPFAEQLNRLAESKIAYPNIDYRRGKDGHLVKLADQIRASSSPAMLLLKEPRQDFKAESHAAFLKVADGGTALVGLVRGDAAGMATQDVGGKKVVKVMICAQAIAGEGRVTSYEGPTRAEVGADGSFLASFRLGLKPGKYTLRAGALDEATKKGSIAESTVEAPDFSREEMTLATLLIIRDVEDNAAGDPQHPFAAFQLGNSLIIPRFGTVFSRDEALSFFYQFYDAKVDEKTGKASAVANLSILKAGKAVAKAEAQPFEVAIGGTVVGPVPLAKYEPGSYVVQLKVTDNVAKKDVTQELAFEIK